ncbi:DUF349 domain-containing protein [Kocuria sp.]|uniref:DUF349 domain-containing protein n=1 Tax=Kocuria sp. TaxID=1871328 RepID=UPI0026E0D068|nr:DUF349 domain-containing protein [Kocuria sp.]MDO5617636.1 DUF349 domain-containing protein [Kocuria sp.]
MTERLESDDQPQPQVPTPAAVKPAGVRPSPTPKPAAPATPVPPAGTDSAAAAPTPASAATPGPTSDDVATPSPAAVAPSGSEAVSETAADGLSAEQLEAARPFGEVTEDGHVYVLVGDERFLCGQVPEVPADEALAYFAKKFEDARTLVNVLEQRVEAGTASSDMNRNADHVLAQLNERKLVGDVKALEARLEALRPRIAELEAEHKRATEAAKAEHFAQRDAIVQEAEQMAAQDPQKIQWKQSSARMAELFDQWKAHQKSGIRLSRKDEEALWKRFRNARTTFDRHRRAYFSQLDENNAEAKRIKEKLISEAEALQSSTDWNLTAGKYRDLMDRWKASPRASRRDDDALWSRFRAAQDVFFDARKSANDQVEQEFEENLKLKQALVEEAKQLLPVTDVRAARKKLSGIQDRWDAIGKVPRAHFKRIENELQAVEDAVREADSGSRAKKVASEPEVRSNALLTQAEDKVTDLQAQVAEAEAAGNASKVKKLSGELSSAEAMRDMIKRSAASL